jgi:hypothetical protein
MWTITNDLVDDGKKVGISSGNYDEAKAPLLKYQFRLLDDDGDIFYEGLSDDCDTQGAFAPLDDFGKGYAGCTEIQYFDGQSWNQICMGQRNTSILWHEK